MNNANNNNNNNNFVILDTGASSTYSPLPSRVRLTAGGNRAQTYPRYITEERTEKTHHPSPTIYTLEFRQAWKTIVDEHNNTTQKKSKKRNRRSNH